MQLPKAKIRKAYIEQIDAVEVKLKSAMSDGTSKVSLLQVQKRLDALADKYQYDEELGAARYKLYELQALVHYFNDDNENALGFIDQAIETRGKNYEGADKLKKQIIKKSTVMSHKIENRDMTKQERRKQRIGLEGWLAFFVVGTGIGILLGVINLLSYGSTFNDLSSASNQATSYVNAISPVLRFEVLTNIISIVLATWLIVLLAQHKKLAKNIAIISLILNILFLTVDYSWAYSVFSSFDVLQYVSTDINKASGDIGRAIFAALIWIPYFLVSKRVKATLTK